MPEEDAKIFSDAYEIYNDYRWTLLTKDEQWTSLIDALYGLVVKYPDSRLALRLAIGLTDTFSDMYMDGKKPPIPDYFGRSDL